MKTMLKVSKHEVVTRFDLARTIAGRGRYWTTAYFIDGLLVDTGCAYTAKELLHALDGIPLSSIVNTHSHEDHIGANGALQQERGDLDVLAHPLAIPILANPRERQPLHFYRRLYWGWPEPSSGKPVLHHEFIETIHYRFRVIYTPGHSPDHLCLYEPGQEWLFTGDLFVGGKDRALRAGYNIWQIIDSLKHVAELPVKWMFPGSARVRENPKQDLASKIAYLEELGGRVLELYRKGWEVRAIVRALCGKPMMVEFVTLGHFSRRNLVLSFIRNHPRVDETFC
jgi:glyoxylase-like metal-dependent hydrolase (beta-lactamase superfamily II)